MSEKLAPLRLTTGWTDSGAHASQIDNSNFPNNMSRQQTVFQLTAMFMPRLPIVKFSQCECSQCNESARPLVNKSIRETRLRNRLVRRACERQSFPKPN